MRSERTGATDIAELGGAALANGVDCTAGIGAIDACDVSGVDIVSYDGTDITVDVTGDYIAAGDFISVTNYGSGTVSITSEGSVTGQTGDGITVSNSGSDIMIDAGDVTGNDGIEVLNDGYGGVSVTSDGTVTGTTSEGIHISNFGGDLTIDVVDVTGADEGILVDNIGSGAISITSTGSITGETGGIYGGNRGTDFTIDVVDVTGNTGIGITNVGSGDVSVTSSGTVTGTGDIYAGGIYGSGVAGINYGMDLTVDVVDVDGAAMGIAAINSGSGAATVTSTGTVTGNGNAGIYAYNGNSATDLTVYVADVSGTRVGIGASNYGSGALTVTSTGTVTSSAFGAYGGYHDAGISASNLGTDLTIDVVDVTGHSTGITAENSGTGSVSVTSSGTVTGEQGDGINVVNHGDALTIDVVDVSGYYDGIDATNYGSGALSITSTGMITSERGAGISASNAHYGGTDLTIDVVGVHGQYSGISAYNGGTGALTITSSGGVSSSEFGAISASNGYSGTDLTIDVVHASGGHGASIGVSNFGTGAVNITSSGTVDARLGEGVSVYSAETTTSVTIDVVDVDGDYGGIDVIHAGTGAVNITSSGTVTTSFYGVGIEAQTYSASTDLTIDVVDVTSGGNGIQANHYGSGELSITSTGTITSDTAHGIDANNLDYGSYVYGTDLTIDVADVAAQYDGIEATHYGSGALTITSSGTVTGEEGSGIDARTGNKGTDLTIDVVDVIGGGYGIEADHDGSGALSLTSTGTISADFGDGIEVRGGQQGTSVTVDVVDVSGGYSGVEVSNFGSGAVNVTSTGTITGGHGTAVSVRNGSYGTSGTDLTIDVADVTGEFGGIDAFNRGEGALTVVSSGTVTGGYSDGISATNYGTDLTIDVGDVTGSRGIEARNEGSGALTITSAGTVEAGTDDTYGYSYGYSYGNDGTGIRATNSGTDLTIDVVDVTGTRGVEARNEGSGSLTITSTGTVTATAPDGYSYSYGYGDEGVGIRASNHGTHLTIDVVDVTGSSAGITANNGGTGALSVTSTGAVTGEEDWGIAATNFGTDLTIDAADVTGGAVGIGAVNYGSGELTITSTGTVTAAYTASEGGYSYYSYGDDYGPITEDHLGSGVIAVNYGTDLTIDVADVTGSAYGVAAVNYGSGALSVTSTGAITGDGAVGISAINSVDGTDLTIDVVDVSGETAGISALNEGSGTTTITVSGVVTSNSGTGIETNGADATITLTAGADVSGGSGAAITDGAGDSVLTVEEGAVVTGEIQMGAGSDTVNFVGSDVSGITLLDGGADVSALASTALETSETAELSIAAVTSETDTLNFIGSTGTIDSSALVNWEAIEIDTDSELSFSGGALEIDELAVESGGILDATGSMSLLGSLANNGIINLQDGSAGDAVTVSGDFSGDGALTIDVDFENNTSDTLEIAGDVTGGTTSLTINDITTGPASGDDIVVVDVAGTTSEGDFELAGGTVSSGIFDYTLGLTGQQWLLARGDVNSTGGAYEGLVASLGGFNDLSTFQQRVNSRQWLSTDGVPSGGWMSVSANVSDGALASTSGAAYDTNVYGIQGGYDFAPVQSDNGTWVFGANGHYTRSTTTFTVEDGSSSVSSDGYGVGASATWHGKDDLYVDLQGRITSIDTDISSASEGDLVTGYASTAYVLSAEVGKTIALSKISSIVPQAQLSFASVNLDPLSDNSGYDVAFDTNESVTVRLGLAYEFDVSATLNVESGSKAYVLGNLSRTSADVSEVNVSGDVLEIDTSGNWFELGAGGSIEWDNGYATFAEASYKTGVGSTTSGNQSFNLRAGLEFNW